MPVIFYRCNRAFGRVEPRTPTKRVTLAQEFGIKSLCYRY
jgi:hypothetical protein